MSDHRSGRYVAALMVALTLGAPNIALAAPDVPSPAPVAVPIAAPVGVPAPGKLQANLPAVKFTRSMAVEIAKKAFAIPDDLGEPNASVNQASDGASWTLEWQSPAKKPDRFGYSVSVDAMTGEIRGYNHWTQSAGDPAPLTYTRAEALKIAQGFLEKLAAGYKDQVRIDDRTVNLGYYGGANASYNFRWERVVSGYPVIDEGVNIAINARTGELDSFNLTWRTNATYQAPDKLLDQAGAEAVFRDQVPTQLQYMHFQKPASDQGEWRLVYRSLPQYQGIDQQGKLVGPDGQSVDPTPYKNLTTVPSADKPYTAPSHQLTQEEALAVAQSVSGQTGAPSNSSYNEWGDEKKSRNWQFSWSGNGPDSESFNVQVDAEKGVITNYNAWGKYEAFKEGEEPPVKEADARKFAVEFIRSFRPDLAGNLLLMPTNEMVRLKMGPVPQPSYNISFMMMKDGIPVADRMVNVDVDVRTGKIRSFWGGDLGNEKDPFPSVASVTLLAMDEVLKARSQYQPVELAWVTFWNAQPLSKGEPVQPAQPALVWTTAHGLPVNAIDAMTLAPLDYQGRDLVEASKFPQDIAGHFAQREIELLWARGIFELTGGMFNPQGTATAAELARWLVLSRGIQPYPAYNFSEAFAGMGAGAPMAAKLEASDAAGYFGAALQSGILMPEDFAADMDPDSPVSRELFALWAVRAMGYGPVAKIANRIETGFADKESIGPKYANAVAILEGLGIIKGSGGSFYPQRSLTRGEAAKILFSVSAQTRR